ncbi:hypothetical protein [Paenibacillus terrigena]|uniref:hypothetical protein n=1 Tax=Paenibacillus terrigena TaxID=369333 RepID=UPI0028D02528|nr:hypothetical protein [Paenibacillus terrigena]
MMIDAHQHYWKLQRGDYGWQAGSFTDMLGMAGASLPSDMTGAQIEAIFDGNAVRTYRLKVKETQE